MLSVTDTLYQDFEKVFNQHYNTLCNYAFSFLKDLQSSEDVVQEVFIRIWEKRQDLITSETIRFYLFSAVRNNCLTYLQKEKRMVIVELNDGNIVGSPDGPEPDNHPGKDYKKHLEIAMQQLPPKCREVFVLSRISKLSYREIADTLGLSIKTVENQMGKALKILRLYLKDQKVFIFFILMVLYGVK